MTDTQFPASLIEHLAKGDVIPLIGAGVSMSIKTKNGSNAFPSWAELLSNSATKLEGENLNDESQLVRLQVKMGMFQAAAQVAQEKLSGRRWHEFIKSQFSVDFTDLDESCKVLPQAIWKLSKRVITLNYDKVLEWAHVESANVCAFDNANSSQLAEFVRAGSKEMLWHLHGRIDTPAHMVITPQSYHRLYQENAAGHYAAALVKLKEIITNKVFLFIGCSLDDAELLAEIIKQNALFEGNTGPHYALVRVTDKQKIAQKLQGTDVQLLTFSDFGQPLIDFVRQLVNCKNQQPGNQLTKHADAPPQQSKVQASPFDSIALLTASPLDRPINHSDIIAKLKKFKHPIFHRTFTESNLMELEGYSILFLIAKNTSIGLLIEDDNACSDYLVINDLKASLSEEVKLTVLITDKLLSEQELEQVDFPLLVLPLISKHGKDLRILDKLTHQLFKKPDVEHFIGNTEIQSVQVNDKLLESLNPENRQNWYSYKPILPRDINPIELQGFTGRLSDLADISQKLAKAASGQRLLTIKGSGGLGKTTIAKKVAMELAIRGRFEAGIYFIDCENLTSANQLEMHVGEAFNLRTADDLFGYLAKHHDQRNRLLIFDNLESLLYLKQVDKSKNKHAVEQVKEVLSRTLNYANVLVTSRESINTDWEDILPFRQMESEEALALFNNKTKNNYISDEDQEFARRKILEPLLNNNPLAIKLICDGMPSGKNLKELKKELEDDFFGKVKEDDLTLIFDDEVDANINRQESLYVSILYSYRTLSESQKRTFESFSLFPDGIDLDTFKRLVSESKRGDRNKEINKYKKSISDKDITVLANKSLVEDYGNFYTLQSVIQRFARFQFEQHTLEEEKLELFRLAFQYNQQLMGFVKELRDASNKAHDIFLMLLNNFLAAISYGARKGVIRNESELKDYFIMMYYIRMFSSSLNLDSEFLAVFREIDFDHFLNKINEEQVRLAIKVIEISAMYYRGDFDAAYRELERVLPIETMISRSGEIESGGVLESIIHNNADNIYTMEGYALNRVLSDIQFNNYEYVSMVNAIVQIAANVELLFGLVRLDFDYFEAQSYLCESVDLAQLDKVIDSLHENEHLHRVSLTYIKSRETYVNSELIDKLVNVNPYTRGLKNLMHAFACEHELLAEDGDTEFRNRSIDYYKSALRDLNHIKFYYVQALYYYSRFLMKICNQDFDAIFKQGLGLTQKYHYRYWQHRFLLLKNPSLGSYKEDNYPLPGNPDISHLIEKQFKWIRKNYGTSLNPFNEYKAGNKNFSSSISS